MEQETIFFLFRVGNPKGPCRYLAKDGRDMKTIFEDLGLVAPKGSCRYLVHTWAMYTIYKSYTPFGKWTACKCLGVLYHVPHQHPV